MEDTRHAVNPQTLLFEVVVNVVMYVVHEVQHFADAGFHRGDKFQQGLGVVCGDVGMGQRRTQCRRVWFLRDCPEPVDAQAFFFQASADVEQFAGSACPFDIF